MFQGFILPWFMKLSKTTKTRMEGNQWRNYISAYGDWTIEFFYLSPFFLLDIEHYSRFKPYARLMSHESYLYKFI